VLHRLSTLVLAGTAALLAASSVAEEKEPAAGDPEELRPVALRFPEDRLPDAPLVPVKMYRPPVADFAGRETAMLPPELQRLAESGRRSAAAANVVVPYMAGGAAAKPGEDWGDLLQADAESRTAADGVDGDWGWLASAVFRMEAEERARDAARGELTDWNSALDEDLLGDREVRNILQRERPLDNAWPMDRDTIPGSRSFFSPDRESLPDLRPWNSLDE